MSLLACASCALTQAVVLQMSGRGQVADDAAADGSSYTCLSCGGLVPHARAEAHAQMWCPQK